MRQPFGKKWMETYNRAFANYLKGNWKEALIHFNQVLEMKPDDKPTLNLAKFMKETEYVAPIKWKGYKYFGE